MKAFKVTLRTVVVTAMSLVSILPFYFLVYIALSSPAGMISDKLSLLPSFELTNFTQAWQKSSIGLAIFNSAVITVGAITLTVLLSSSAGYAVARFKSRLNAVIFFTLLACMMIPGIINTVPLYTLMIQIGGINTHWAMILVCACNVLPFSVFLYTGFIKTVPREVEESAIIDGCTYFSAFWRITFHFLKPVTASVIILNGVSIWNNYAQAVFFLQSEQMRTIPLAVSMFFQQYGAQWNLMAATALIGVFPAVAAFLLFQKYFIKGIAAGAVKG